MPTYDYACNACANRFEKVQSFTEDAIKICPVCGKEAVRRVYSPAGIIFKGSGWYINDSRKSNTPAPANAKADGKTESKPDAVPADSKTGESKPAETTPDKKPVSEAA